MKRVALTKLKTRRLDLVPFTQDHARDVDTFSGLWEVARYTTGIPHPYPPGDALAFAYDVELDRRNDVGAFVFAIALKGQQRIVGVVEVDLTDDNHSAELGLAFSPDVWRRGLATEAAMAVINWAFTGIGVDEVVASALVENRASCRVLQKAGLRRIGNSAGYMPARSMTGLFEDYRLLRREWQP